MRSGRGRIGRPAAFSDEYLDFMGQRFLELRVRQMTRATFEQYLGSPRFYEVQAGALRRGRKLQFAGDAPGEVNVL